MFSVLLTLTNQLFAEDVVPIHKGLLAIDITMPDDNDYDKALKADIDSTSWIIFWDYYEKESGKYNPDRGWFGPDFLCEIQV